MINVTNWTCDWLVLTLAFWHSLSCSVCPSQENISPSSQWNSEKGATGGTSHSVLSVIAFIRIFFAITGNISRSALQLIGLLRIDWTNQETDWQGQSVYCRIRWWVFSCRLRVCLLGFSLSVFHTVIYFVYIWQCHWENFSAVFTSIFLQFPQSGDLCQRI